MVKINLTSKNGMEKLLLMMQNKNTWKGGVFAGIVVYIVLLDQTM